jgi:SulP family sulfate permease
MISLGVANAANALGGGMPASGSITRSCLNWSTGAQNPAASLFSGVLLLGGIFAFGPLVGFVPQAAISAIVVAVGLGLIGRGSIHTILRITRADPTTFLITLIGACSCRCTSPSSSA